MSNKLLELIDKFSNCLTQSETEVRTKFVIPFFELLRYPFEMRAEEFPVYGNEGGKEIRAKSADILFFNNREFSNYRTRNDVKWVHEHSLLVVEIKKRGESIEVQGQAVYYAAWTRAILYVITNGEKIAFYKVNSNYSDTQVLECSISEIPDKWDIINSIYNYNIVLKTKEQNSYFNKEYKDSRYTKYCNELIILTNERLKGSISRYMKKQENNYFDTILINENNHKSIEYNAILNSEANKIIVSEPGGGKSYLLNMIVREYLAYKKEESDRVPVIIKSRYFGRMFSSFEEAIYKQVATYNNLLTIEDIKLDIEKGKFLILIDAIDEVTCNKDVYLEMIKTLSTSTDSRIIVTSRKEVYNYELDSNFELYSIVPLEKREIDEYFRKNTKDKVSLYQLNLDDRFIKLISTPLFLFMTLQVITNSNNYELPSNKSRLFDIYFKFPLKEKLNHSQINIIEKILSRYAEYLFYNQESEDKLYNIIIEYAGLNNYEKYYELIISSGVLVNGENGLVFFHQTFLEYFYAKEISKYSKEKLQLFLKDRIYDVNYTEIICFTVGIISDGNRQNYVLDYLENRNLRLYIKAVNSRFKFEKSNITKKYNYSYEYFKQLRNTYINIVNKYFNEIINHFSPYSNDFDSNISDIKIIGNINYYKQNIHVKFEVVDKNSEKVEFTEVDSEPQIYTENNLSLGKIISITGGEIPYFDLKHLSYGLDSSREIALLIIQHRLKQIIKNEKYVFDVGNSILMSELIEHNLKKLRDYDALPKALKGLSLYNNDIELVCKVFYTHRHLKGIRLKNSRILEIPFELLYYYAKMLYFDKEDVSELLIPLPDINYSQHGGVISKYSDNQLVRVIERIIILVNKSYRDVIEKIFYGVKNEMYNYCNPCKSVIWINRENIGGSIDEIKVKSNVSEALKPTIFINQTPPDFYEKDSEYLEGILFNEGKTRDEITTWSSGNIMIYFDEKIIHKMVYKLIQNDIIKLFEK